MVKLEMLRVYRAVAEKGSLAGAAALLRRTPSAISMTLAQLESEVGAPLFESDRKNRLSPLGKLVLEESKRASDTFDRSVEAIRRHAASLAGTVRIAAVPSAVTGILPDAIRAFRVHHPQVRLEVSDVDSQSVRTRVALDRADIGLVSTKPEESGHPILQDDLGILCHCKGPTARALTEGADPSWSLVLTDTFIANPLSVLIEHPAVREATERCALEARNTTALISFVRAGLGATILPQSVHDPSDPDVLFVRPEDPRTQRQLHKILGDAGRFSPAVQAFWDVL